MLWIWLYIILMIILGIFILYMVYSSNYDHRPIIDGEIIVFIIISPIVISVGLLKVLIESIVYLFSKLHYFSRFWKKQTVGIMVSDIRWVYAINGKLQPEKRPVVHKIESSGEMVLAGGYIYSREAIVTVNPIISGVVCRYDEMKFMVKSFLKETFQYFSFKSYYNIAIPGVTAYFERNALIESFRPKIINTVLIPEVLSYSLDESNFGLIYLAHSFTEITTVKNCIIQKSIHDNIGLDDLAIFVIKAVCSYIKVSRTTRIKALSSLMNEEDFIITGPNSYTASPLKINLSVSDFHNYTTHWIKSIKNLFMKLSKTNFKWYIISEYGKLDMIAALLSDECAVKIQPINDSYELLAKELSLNHYK